jgi:hypothetical protein
MRWRKWGRISEITRCPWRSFLSQGNIPSFNYTQKWVTFANIFKPDHFRQTELAFRAQESFPAKENRTASEKTGLQEDRFRPSLGGQDAQNRSPSVPVSLYHGLINGRARIGSIGFGMRRALERFPLPLERGVSVFVGTPRKVSDTIHLLSRPLSAKSYRMIHLERGREIDGFNVFCISNISRMLQRCSVSAMYHGFGPMNPPFNSAFPASVICHLPRQFLTSLRALGVFGPSLCSACLCGVEILAKLPRGGRPRLD